MIKIAALALVVLFADLEDRKEMVHMPELEQQGQRVGDFRQGQASGVPGAAQPGLSGVRLPPPPLTQDVVDPRTGQALAANFAGSELSTTGNIPPPAPPPVTGEPTGVTGGGGAVGAGEPPPPSVGEMTDAELAAGIASAEQAGPLLVQVPIVGGALSTLSNISLADMQREQGNRQGTSTQAASDATRRAEVRELDSRLAGNPPGASLSPGFDGGGGGGNRDSRDRSGRSETTSSPGGIGGV